MSALHGRKRTTKACNRCRSKKQKCNGTFPCETCYISNKQCTYAEDKEVEERLSFAEKEKRLASYNRLLPAFINIIKHIHFLGLDTQVSELQFMGNIWRENEADEIDINKATEILNSFKFASRQGSVSCGDSGENRVAAVTSHKEVAEGEHNVQLGFCECCWLDEAVNVPFSFDKGQHLEASLESERSLAMNQSYFENEFSQVLLGRHATSNGI